MSLTRRLFIQRMAQIGGYSAAFSTMQALGLIAGPGVSPLPQLAADFGKGKKIVILGAGIAGLVAAYELRKAGFERRLFQCWTRSHSLHPHPSARILPGAGCAARS